MFIQNESIISSIGLATSLTLLPFLFFNDAKQTETAKVNSLQCTAAGIIYLSAYFYSQQSCIGIWYPGAVPVYFNSLDIGNHCAVPHCRAQTKKAG